MDLTYERTEYFDGEPAKAIEIARNTFLPHGFEIIRSDESYLELANNSFPWGRNPNPIRMISNARILFNNGEITLQAKLNNIKKILLYLCLFIIGMAVFFLITFGIVFGLKQHQPMGKIVWISLAPFVPWPFLIPIIIIWLRRITNNALDILMNNMLSVSQSTGS